MKAISPTVRTVVEIQYGVIKALQFAVFIITRLEFTKCLFLLYAIYPERVIYLLIQCIPINRPLLIALGCMRL
jgi:hypothetical protein